MGKNIPENPGGEQRADREASRGERGASRLKIIFWTGLLAAFIYVCYKTIPIYFSNYQLQDDLRQEALYSLGKYNDDAERTRIFAIMQKDDVAADKDAIRLLQNDSRGLKIQVDYTVPVDLVVYTWNMHFTPSSDNQALVQ